MGTLREHGIIPGSEKLLKNNVGTQVSSQSPWLPMCFIKICLNSRFPWLVVLMLFVSLCLSLGELKGWTMKLAVRHCGGEMRGKKELSATLLLCRVFTLSFVTCFERHL